MQNPKESGGFHRDEPNRDSCRPDDVTISKNASVQRIEECARIAGPHAEPLTGVAVNRRDMRRSTRRQFETMIRVYGNNLKGNALPMPSFGKPFLPAPRRLSLQLLTHPRPLLFSLPNSYQNASAVFQRDCD